MSNSNGQNREWVWDEDGYVEEKELPQPVHPQPLTLHSSDGDPIFGDMATMLICSAAD